MDELKKSAVTDVKVLDIYLPRQKPQHIVERDFYSLSYRYMGKIRVEAEGCTYTSDEGSITFVPKRTAYCTEVLEDTHMIAMHFDLLQEIQTSGVCVIKDRGNVLKPYFDRLASAHMGAESCDFAAMALFYQLLFELSAIEKTQNAPAPIAILAKNEIDKGFQEPSLTISAISDKLGFSDSYLRRIFRAEYGMSPMEYLTAVRIRYAKNLLESDFLSIEQIGTLCGFQSVGYFIQSFRKQTGETPGAYRKRMRAIPPANITGCRLCEECYSRITQRHYSRITQRTID